MFVSAYLVMLVQRGRLVVQRGDVKVIQDQPCAIHQHVLAIRRHVTVRYVCPSEVLVDAACLLPHALNGQPAECFAALSRVERHPIPRVVMVQSASLLDSIRGT